MHLHNTNNLQELPLDVVQRHRMFTSVANGYLTLKQAARHLALSFSQTKRLWRRFRDSHRDLTALMPSPRRRAPVLLTPEVTSRIAAHILTHPERSCLHLTDTLRAEGLKVSRETVRRIRKDVIKERHRTSGRTKPATRFEANAFGEIVQMDTCVGAWLQGSGYQNLIVCLYDHSRFVLSAAIFSKDSTWTNLCVIRQMIETWGLPQILYTDNASHFKVIRHKDLKPWNYPDHYRTRIQEVLASLGITHVAHHPFNPRAKGKIERFFRFIQARLLRTHPARNLIELNYWLHVWLKWYNEEHVNATTQQKPCFRQQPSVFRPLPAGINLDEIFVIKETRVVNKDNSFSFRGKSYFIPEKHHVATLKVELRLTDHDIFVYANGIFLVKFTLEYHN